MDPIIITVIAAVVALVVGIVAGKFIFAKDTNKRDHSVFSGAFQNRDLHQRFTSKYHHFRLPVQQGLCSIESRSKTF